MNQCYFYSYQTITFNWGYDPNGQPTVSYNIAPSIKDIQIIQTGKIEIKFCDIKFEIKDTNALKATTGII